MAEYRVAVLASGNGSNLQALIDQVHGRDIASIVLVASDRAEAGALERARTHGIPAHALPPWPGEGRGAYHRRLAELVGATQPHLLVLAGYMRLLPQEFISKFSAIINVHPSLLPAFPGLDAPGQALTRGVKVSGCTVHLVDAGMDTGPILTQVAVPVFSNDSVETLHNRIKVHEHKALVEAVVAFARGKIELEGDCHAG